MLIKRDLKWIERYVKKEGYICFENNTISVYDTLNKTLETHKYDIEFSNNKKAINLQEFLRHYKSIHGARNIFDIKDNQLFIYKKKNNELEKTTTFDIQEADDMISFSSTSPSFATISQPSLKMIGIFDKMHINLNYIPFLSNPILFINYHDCYIWGTDGIHEMKINCDAVKNNKSLYYIPQSLCKFIQEFSEFSDEGQDFSMKVEDNKLLLASENHSLIIPLTPCKDNIPCQIQEEEEYQLTEEELKALKVLKLKTMLAQANKQVKDNIEVTLEIKEGAFYLKGNNIFQISQKISLNKPIHAYKFYEFLQRCEEIYINPTYLRSEKNYFIL